MMIYINGIYGGSIHYTLSEPTNSQFQEGHNFTGGLRDQPFILLFSTCYVPLTYTLFLKLSVGKIQPKSVWI